MSEEYPLLFEESSDEDRLKARSPRLRLYPRTRRRVKYHIKGAAMIMSRWPDYWKSSLNYLCVCLGMITLFTFIMTFLVIHGSEISSQSSSMVNMHLFVNTKMDLNKYIPHIEIFAKKYKHYKYNLFVITNDTIKEMNNFTDKTNNDVALNSLWDNDMHDMFYYANSIHGKRNNKNIYVNYVALSQLLNDSPLLHQWKKIPHQFIPFLVRAASIWNKGGIAVNPDIFIPNSPLAAYVNKFDQIIRKIKKKIEIPVSMLNHSIKQNKLNQNIPKVNNIRDIINALESRNNTGSSDEETLYAAESRNSFSLKNIDSEIVSIQKGSIADKKTIQLIHNINFKSFNQSATNSDQPTLENNKDRLPPILNVLNNYHKANKTLVKERYGNMREWKSTNDEDYIQANNNADNYKPMIVSAKEMTNNRNFNKDKAPYQDDNNDNVLELTVIDLLGNIIATETPCHAFIGDLFVNAIHHDTSESISDFIIKELSIFCKGLMKNCIGIDIIL